MDLGENKSFRLHSSCSQLFMRQYEQYGGRHRLLGGRNVAVCRAGVGVGVGWVAENRESNLPTRKKREAKLWAPGSEFFLVFFFKTLLTCQTQRTVNLCLLKTP